MTCIAGLVHDGAVYLGGDSAGTGAGDQITLTNPKVFTHSGFVFGYAGEFRFGQVLQYHLKPPRYKGQDPMEYMVTDFVPALRKACGHARFLGRDDNGREQGGWGIVGFRGHMFRLQDSFDVLENMDGIDAIGTGMPYALAVLQANHDKTDPAARIGQALQIAEHYCLAVRGPFTLVTLEKPDEPKRNAKNSRGPRRQQGG
jgi:ATP-dependent protease HslVU (ClpYQ) peptidase subunit